MPRVGDLHRTDPLLVTEAYKSWSLLALLIWCRTESQEILPVLLSSCTTLGRSLVLSDFPSPRTESGGAVVLVGASRLDCNPKKRKEKFHSWLKLL